MKGKEREIRVSRERGGEGGKEGEMPPNIEGIEGPRPIHTYS